MKGISFIRTDASIKMVTYRFIHTKINSIILRNKGAGSSSRQLSKESTYASKHPYNFSYPLFLSQVDSSSDTFHSYDFSFWNLPVLVIHSMSTISFHLLHFFFYHSFIHFENSTLPHYPFRVQWNFCIYCPIIYVSLYYHIILFL